jgi:hypothetical protein
MINQGFPNRTTSNILYCENRLLQIAFSQVYDLRKKTARIKWEILGSSKQYPGREFSGFFSGEFR